MRRILTIATAGLLTLPLLVAATQGPLPAPGCESVAGREPLGLDGFSLTYDAPAMTAPELAATNDITGDVVTNHRSASFWFYADAAPYDEMKLDVSLTWDDPSDFDVYLFDDSYGFELRAAGSDTSNFEEQTTSESFSYTIGDCTPFHIVTRAWAGAAVETLNLQIEVTPVGDPADEAPRNDAPTILYASSDRPGQAAMLHDYVGNDNLPQSRLVPERPTTGQPNQYTRPILGFDDAKNPFLPFFTRQDFAAPLAMDGEVSALVWASSSTMPQGESELLVHLFADGTDLGPAAIPASELGDEPRPFLVSFGVHDIPAVFDLTLQVGVPPAVSTEGPGDPSHASHTVWYDSVQYQSRVILH